MSAVSATLSVLKNFVTDLVLPPVCLGCNAFGELVCTSCQHSFQSLTTYICPGCLKGSLYGTRHPKCRGHLQGLTSCAKYERNLRKIIKTIKYGSYYAGIKPLVNYVTGPAPLKSLPKKMNTTAHQANQDLTTNPAFTAFLAQKPLLIPVPLHKKRQRTRGFNQAALIARAMTKLWHLPYSDKIIVRVKNTPFQAELSKQQRQFNIKDAFAPSTQVIRLGPRPLKNHPVLLVDDVWTTGATLQACARAVVGLGAKPVWAFTLAR